MLPDFYSLSNREKVKGGEGSVLCKNKPVTHTLGLAQSENNLHLACGMFHYSTVFGCSKPKAALTNDDDL